MDAEELERQAAKGNPSACMILGRKLMRGRGAPRNYERALQFFDTAARAGDADALYLLGKCYLKGVGCTKDPSGGVSCLEAAAQRGHAAAALRLGKCFAEGLGAPLSAEMAAYWYRKAAALGESRAYDLMLQLAPRSRQKPAPGAEAHS